MQTLIAWLPLSGSGGHWGDGTSKRAGSKWGQAERWTEQEEDGWVEYNDKGSPETTEDKPWKSEGIKITARCVQRICQGVSLQG